LGKHFVEILAEFRTKLNGAEITVGVMAFELHESPEAGRVGG
jgi:hypothetical protein